MQRWCKLHQNETGWPLARGLHMPVSDMNRREDDEARLEECRRHFAAIVETIDDGILVLDAQSRVLYGNPTAGALLNAPVQCLQGNTLDLSLPESGSVEMDLPRPDGEPRHVLIRAHATMWDGKPARLVALLDITKRKETEDELESARQAQLRMKDEFLSRVSHELRSPLTAVYQYVTILLDGLAGEINADQRNYLGITLRNVNQLRAMIGDLLDVTRSRSGKLSVAPGEMKLAGAVRTAIETVRHEAQTKNQTLTIEVSEDLPSAFADPMRVQQIIVNLVGNAIKFTRPGGAIRVSARMCVPATGGRATLEVAVADNGCGIDPEDHERIFHHLYQVDKNIDQKRMGLGLGLHICRDLVTRLGGRIWVKSLLGHGSTFFFTLPIYDPELAVMFLVQNRLERARANGETFAVAVVVADAPADAIRPVWEALLPVLKRQAFTAAYAGQRLVVLAEEEESQTDFVRNHLRRLAKDACFTAAPDLCPSLSYSVATSSADTDTAEALLERAGAAAITECSILAKKRLIAVDDDENCLRMLHRVLTGLGVRSVRKAGGGNELFAALEEELPDLIVLDIQMPGMNGHEIIGRLKEDDRTAAIPIVVVSGYVGEHNRIEDKSLGMTIPVLSKLNITEVRRWVQYLL